MATTNYSWNLPTVGGSEDTWGTQLNANWTALDTLLGGTNATEFEILDGATITTAELNVLDGITASTAELNLLDGVTLTLTAYNSLAASAAELNILSGAIITTTELNYLDGVTSNIQSQINSIVAGGGASDSTITISASSGLTGGGSFTLNQAANATVSVSHADTSSQATVSNSGLTFVQGVTLDTYGHVTGIASGSVTIPDNAIGVSQTWKNSTTSATNGSGKPIMVAAYQQGNLPSVVVGGITIQDLTANASGAAAFIVPNGVSYTVTFSGTPGYVRELS